MNRVLSITSASWILRASGLLLASCVSLAGCATSPYELPAPPRQDEQRAVAVDPAEQAELERRNYLSARAALLDLYKALAEEDFEAAKALLSQQTRDFLAHGSKTADAASVLASGQLMLPDGRTVTFEPVAFLLGGKVRQIEDTRRGVEEHETPRRRELFVTEEGGASRKVVMIFEGDQWVLHRTEINPDEE